MPNSESVVYSLPAGDHPWGVGDHPRDGRRPSMASLNNSHKANGKRQIIQNKVWKSKLQKRNWTIRISQIKFHKANCKNQTANQIAKKEITLTIKIIPKHSSYYVGSKTSLCRLCKPSLHYTFFSPSLVNTSEVILVPGTHL